MADFLDVLRILPWGLVIALGSLLAVVLSWRSRPDLFEKFGFGGPEVALLALGSVAGGAVNFPLAPLGDSAFLALNLGGALLSVFLAALWIRRGVMNPWLAAIGVGLVSAVAYLVVEFEPDAGIVSEFPWFFLPSVAAVAYAFIACQADWPRSVPLAFVGGSLGALLGADIYNLGALHAYFSQAGEVVVVSVGGAGVFDMVFLAGTLAMAASVGISSRLVPRTEVRRPPPATYPSRALDVRDPEETWAAFTRLENPNFAERATGSLALAHAALRAGDFARSVRMSYLAVDSALSAGDPPFRTGLSDLPEAMRRDLDALAASYRAAREGPVGRDVAGNSVQAARYVLGSLLPRSGLLNRLVTP